MAKAEDCKPGEMTDLPREAIEAAARKLPLAISYDNVERALAAALPFLRPAPSQCRVRHKKRGSTYRVIGEATMQATSPPANGERVVVYQAEHPDGQLWVRPRSEFNDGRFEELTPDDLLPAPSQGDEERAREWLSSGTRERASIAANEGMVHSLVNLIAAVRAEATLAERNWSATTAALMGYIEVNKDCPRVHVANLIASWRKRGEAEARVKELTEAADWGVEAAKLLSEANDRETALRARLEAAGKALKPFAEIADCDISDDESDEDLFSVMLEHRRGPKCSVGLFRRARSALSEIVGG